MDSKSNKIRKQRKILTLSTRELSSLTKIPEKYLIQYESNIEHANLSTIEKIAKATGTQVNDWVEEEYFKSIKPKKISPKKIDNKENDFITRLKNYRESNGMTKREFSRKIKMSESYYSMIENGTRNASKTIIEKLVNYSGLSEVYWYYGITDNEQTNNNDDYKNIKKVIEQVIELDLVKNMDKLFCDNYKEGTIEEMLIAALKKDIKEYIQRQK